MKICRADALFFGKDRIKMIRRLFGTLTKFELTLWLLSVGVIVLSSVAVGITGAGIDYLSTIASLIGVTSLIFIAKGNVVGQGLTVVFSLFYGFISFGFRYYGEMITYLGMTAPMAVLAIFTWLKHPSDKGAAEVLAAKLTKKRIVGLIFFTALATTVFGFILKALDTANLVVSTISVATSFIASYLTWCRSPYYALGYAANDIVLIVLWTAAAFEDPSSLAMVSCFTAFLANDIYGFISWKKRLGHQG